MIRSRKHYAQGSGPLLDLPAPPASVAVDDVFAVPPSAEDLCEAARALIAEGATQDQVLHALIDRYGYRDELLGRASALADERFLRGGDWTWYQTSRSFQTMLGPGPF